MSSVYRTGVPELSSYRCCQTQGCRSCSPCPWRSNGCGYCGRTLFLLEELEDGLFKVWHLLSLVQWWFWLVCYCRDDSLINRMTLYAINTGVLTSAVSLACLILVCYFYRWFQCSTSDGSDFSTILCRIISSSWDFTLCSASVCHHFIVTLLNIHAASYSLC